MESINIPNLDRKASRIAVGTWDWKTGFAQYDKERMISTIHRALDLGINCVDTAPLYGKGQCEEITGEAIKRSGKRDKIVLVSKVGLSWDEKGAWRDASQKAIEQGIEDSLRRLQVETIDIFLVHWPDEKTPFAETAEAMHHLLREGKIQAIGVSNYSTKEMDAFQKACPIHVLQSPYNLFERGIEKEQIPYCLQRKIATMGYGSFCRGLLSGKMSLEREFKEDDYRKGDPKFQQPRFTQYVNCADKLQRWVEEKHHRSLGALAFRFMLDKGIGTAILGANKPEHLDGVEEAFGWKLGAEDFQEIDQIINQTVLDPVDASFMAPPNRE